MASITSQRIAALRDAKGLAIGEIAGRDSIAALITACQTHAVKVILPTAVYTGTEYGDWDVINGNLEVLKERLGGDCTVLDLIVLGNPSLWAALNGRYSTVLFDRHGMFSPCLACHLYMHLCRVPLSLALGKAPIISGERDLHQGCIKLSQTASTIDAERDILAHAGITLLLPVRDIDDNAQIEAIVGSGWKQGQRQLKCVHSGNFKNIDGTVPYDEAVHRRYLDEFLIPCGRVIIDVWLKNSVGERNYIPAIDYRAIIKNVITLQGGTAS
ncbi:MAG TPA: hypothetical protein VGK02_00775 [Candidatus Aquicultor sp.]